MTDEVANLVRLKEKQGLPTSQAIIAAMQFFLDQSRYDRDRHYGLIQAQAERIKRLEQKISGRDAE